MDNILRSHDSVPTNGQDFTQATAVRMCMHCNKPVHRGLCREGHIAKSRMDRTPAKVRVEATFPQPATTTLHLGEQAINQILMGLPLGVKTMLIEHWAKGSI